MDHDAEVNVEIDMLGDSHAEWTPWCETVGFVVRRITKRRFKSYGDMESVSWHPDENLVVEFDILTGWMGQYVTTGLWALDARSLRPISGPVCTPLSFEVALSRQRIHTDIPLSKAEEILLKSLRRRFSELE